MPALTPEQARSTFPASPGAADGVFSNRPGSLTGVLVMTAGPTDGVSGVSSTVLDQSTTVQNVLPFDANVGGYLLGRSGSHLRQLPFSLFGRALLTAGTSQTGRELLQLGSLALASPTGTADASTFLRGDNTWQPLSGIVTTDASLLTSGTLADARLSSNVPLKNASNTFTAGQTITGVLNLNDQYNAAIVQANGTQVFRSLVAAGPWVDTPTTTYFQVGVVGGNICFSGGSVSASRLAFVADATVFGVNNSSIPAPSSGDVVTIRTDNAGYRALKLQGVSSQTGNLLELWGVSSTSTQRVQAAINSGWADSTDATRRGQLTLSAYQQATKVDAVRVGVEATYGTPRTRLLGETEVMCQSYELSQADAHQYYFRFKQFRALPHGISLDTYDTYDGSFQKRVLSAAGPYLAIGGNVFDIDWAMCLVNSNTLMNALGQGRFSFGESTGSNSNWLQVYHGSTFGAADTFTVATQRCTDSTVANNPELVFRSRQFSFYTGSAYNAAGLRTLLVKSDNTVLWGNAGVLLFDQLETAPRIFGLRIIQNNENSILIGGSTASVIVSNAGWTQVENAASCDTDATLKLQYRGAQLAPLLQVVPATTTPDLVKLCNNAGTAKLTVSGEGHTYGGHMIRWPNLTTGDKAGLDWWRGGSFGVRMRVDPVLADLNVYDTGSGSEVLRFGLSSAMTNIASGRLVLGYQLSTYARLQANRYTGGAVEAFRLETFEAGETAARLALWATASVGDQAKMQVRRSDLYFQRDSSTTADQDVAGILPAWADSTHATRTGQVSIGAYYTGTLQEGLRIVAQSSGVPILRLNAAPSFAAGGLTGGLDFDLSSPGNTGIQYYSGNLCFFMGGILRFNLSTGKDFRIPSDHKFGWSSATTNDVYVDTALIRNAAGVVEVNNGTAGTYRDLRLRNVRTEATTVAGLVAAATAGAGARAFVTDATATTFASAVTGGGANAVPVYSDGSAWYIG